MMEHNSKTATRAKFLPIALIVLGLVFASWLSIDKNENRGDESTSAADTIPADTTIEKESSASYSKRTIIRYDEEGEPHEETVEEFSGDEDMREALENQMNLSVPDAPDFPNFPNFPDAPEWPDMTGMQPLLFNFHLDSMHDGSWGNFTNEFRENLSEQMSQFRQLQSRQLDEQMQRMEKELSRMERALDEMPLITEEQMQRMQADINGKMQRIPNDFMEENYWEGIGEMIERQMRNFETNFKRFEDGVLRKQLEKDGYLKKGESIDEFIFDDNGSIKINGRSIREKDLLKYQELRSQFLRDKTFLGKPE